MDFKLIFCLFLFLFAQVANGQRQYNEFNPEFTNSDVLWFRAHGIDLTAEPIDNQKLFGHLNKSILFRDQERKESALTAIWAALGIAGIVYGAVGKGNSFRSDSINAILGMGGLVASSISVKYYLDKRGSNRKKKEHLELIKVIMP